MQNIGFDVFTAIDTVLDNQAISLETHKKLTIMINEMLLTDAEVAQKKVSAVYALTGVSRLTSTSGHELCCCVTSRLKLCR